MACAYTLRMTGVLLISFASALAPPVPRPWMNLRETPEDRAAKLVKDMTLAEKLHLFHGSCDDNGYVGNVCGIERLGIPSINLNDGPQGYRDTDRPGTTTAFPCGLAIGATWDEQAAHDWGAAMGKEFYGKGANVQLGPGVCVARVPRNGRNFEYLSGEDPHLGYVLVQPVVKGIQSQGVVANAKHWVNNNQETDRFTVDEEVDERTQFELYYPPFEGAIAANVGSFMCSYNKIRSHSVQGTGWACENPETLQRDLKERLGYKGWVMSDWWATHSLSMMQGLDQEMPNDAHMNDSVLLEAVNSGALPMTRVDDAALRILTPLFSVGVFDANNTNTQGNNVTSAEHVALARSLAAQSIVLLKNEGSVLPLKGANSSGKAAPGGPGLKIALIGRNAKDATVGGGGSGEVLPAFKAVPFDAICRKLGLTPPRPPLPPPANCSDGDFEVGFDYHNTDAQTSASADSVEECCSMCAVRRAAARPLHSHTTETCNYFTYVAEGSTCFMKV